MSIVKITPAGEKLSCKAGETVKFQFSVSNTSGKQLRYGAEIRLDGTEDWITVEGNLEGDLGQGVDTTVNVAASPPRDLVNKGENKKSYSFRLRIYDAQSPEDAVDSATVSVDVLPAEEEDHKKPLIWPWIVGAIVILIVISGITWKLLSGPDQMLDYKGKKWADIEEDFDDFTIGSVVTGFMNSSNSFVVVAVEDYGEAIVLEHTPAGGSEISKGDSLTFKLGLPTVKMPKLTDLNPDEAIKLIEEVGLEFGQQRLRKTSDVKFKNPTVLDQEPNADELVLAKTKVNLIVSQFEAAAVANKENECAQYVQNRIAWDIAGREKVWMKANLVRLCKGTTSKFSPGNCFDYFMHKGSSWGAKSGHNITWQNGVDLCEGISDAKATTTCFKGEISKGKSVEQAVKQCTRLIAIPLIPAIQIERLRPLLHTN